MPPGLAAISIVSQFEKLSKSISLSSNSSSSSRIGISLSIKSVKERIPKQIDEYRWVHDRDKQMKEMEKTMITSARYLVTLLWRAVIENRSDSNSAGSPSYPLATC